MNNYSEAAKAALEIAQLPHVDDEITQSVWLPYFKNLCTHAKMVDVEQPTDRWWSLSKDKTYTIMFSDNSELKLFVNSTEYDTVVSFAVFERFKVITHIV